MLIRDHINLTARSPIEGAHFVDLTDLYSAAAAGAVPRGRPDASTRASTCSSPARTTRRPAEIEMVRRIGGDLVGMSTTLEAIAAREAGMEVLGISLVTNLAAGISGEPLDHAEVLRPAAPPRPGWATCSPDRPRSRDLGRASQGRRRGASSDPPEVEPRGLPARTATDPVGVVEGGPDDVDVLGVADDAEGSYGVARGPAAARGRPARPHPGPAPATSCLAATFRHISAGR